MTQTSSLDNRYIVKVTGVAGDTVLPVEYMGMRLHASSDKVRDLLERLQHGPVVVSHPAQRERAELVQQRFTELGFSAELIYVGEKVEASDKPPGSGQVVSGVSSGASSGSIGSSASSGVSSSGSGSGSRDISSNDAFSGLSKTEIRVELPESEKNRMQIESSITSIVSPKKKRRIGLQPRFLLTTLLPLGVTVACAVLSIILIVPNNLKKRELKSVYTTAVAFASSIQGIWPTGVNIDTPAQAASIREVLVQSQPKLRREQIEFALITDARGKPLLGWYGDDLNLSKLPTGLATYIQTTARRVTARAYLLSQGIQLGPKNQSGSFVDAVGVELEVSGAPIDNNGIVNAVVIVATRSDTIRQDINNVINTILVFSLVPIIIAAVTIIVLVRSLTQRIITMSKAADEISVGNYETPLVISTDDELSDLSIALERMRTSLQESIARLRKRRR
jgi:HAMP domain-containing protein